MQHNFGYIETDDDNADERATLSSISRTRGLFMSHMIRIFYETDTPLIFQYVYTGWMVGSICTNSTLPPGLEPGLINRGSEC